MGIPCDELTYVYGDNTSVLANTSAPASQLWNNSNSIYYHFVREGVEWDEWRTTSVNMHDNTPNFVTKAFPRGTSDGNLCAAYFTDFFPKSRSVLQLYGKSETLGIFIFYFMDWV